MDIKQEERNAINRNADNGDGNGDGDGGWRMEKGCIACRCTKRLIHASINSINHRQDN